MLSAFSLFEFSTWSATAKKTTLCSGRTPHPPPPPPKVSESHSSHSLELCFVERHLCCLNFTPRHFCNTQRVEMNADHLPSYVDMMKLFVMMFRMREEPSGIFCCHLCNQDWPRPWETLSSFFFFFFIFRFCPHKLHETSPTLSH